MIKRMMILSSRDDIQWVDRLGQHISGLVGTGFELETDVWNESRIDTGKEWFPELETALNNTDLLILMASKSFMQSPLMLSNKLKDRLKSKQEGEFPLYLVLANKCPWKRFSWMKHLPQFPGNGKYLTDLSSSLVDGIFSGLAKEVKEELLSIPKINQGTLAYLQLNEIGPAKQLSIEPGRRLNIITGDNGLGKTFLLECAWWTLSGVWPKYPVYPRDNESADDASIRLQLRTTRKKGETEETSLGKVETFRYDRQKGKWPENLMDTGTSGLAVYAGVDGSFAVWDPVRSNISPPAGAKKKGSPLVFDKTAIYEGIEEEIPGQKDRVLCNGLISDWISWQMDPNSPFKVFENILDGLSIDSWESLKPGEPLLLPPDFVEKVPSLRYPYGEVPIIFSASSVQRILALAYFILWTWEGHKSACKGTGVKPYKNMIILIDEIESHLHPQWQRTIVPALLQVNQFLDDQLDIQFLITTHSPLVLASVEPVFDQDNDKLFHLDYNRIDILNDVINKEQQFLRYGRVDNWFTSDTFGLGHARSLEAEKAIRGAQALQEKDNPAKEEVENMHRHLVKYLSDFDDFWPLWTFFAKKRGVKV